MLKRLFVVAAVAVTVFGGLYSVAPTILTETGNLIAAAALVCGLSALINIYS